MPFFVVPMLLIGSVCTPIPAFVDDGGGGNVGTIGVDFDRLCPKRSRSEDREPEVDPDRR